MDKQRGWQHDEYPFEDFYDSYLSVRFEYNGKHYRISCESDQAMYDEDTGDVLWHFNSKEEFYSGKIFGKSIKEIIDNSYVGSLL